MNVENENGQPNSAETTGTTAAADGASVVQDIAGTDGNTSTGTPDSEGGGAGGADGQGEDGGNGDTDPANTVPESYQFTVPEGIEGLTLDQGLTDQFAPVFKELGLTQAQADKLVAVYAERVAADATSAKDAMVGEWQTQVRGWEESARKDAEFGGVNFEANLAIAQQTLKRYSSPELDRLLTETGLGSHPDLVRAFVRIGKATAEDRPAPSSGTGVEPAKDHASVLYGNSAGG